MKGLRIALAAVLVAGIACADAVICGDMSYRVDSERRTRTVFVGDSTQLSLTVELWRENCENKVVATSASDPDEFTYASMDTSVATVSPSGVIRGVKPGLAHVLAYWTSISIDHVIVVSAR